MKLSVRIGYSSLTGPRPRNEDFCGSVTPEGTELENKGLMLAVADGVGGHANGREASEYTVRGLLSDYYATPDTWAIPHALDKVISALNRWLISHANKARENIGMATTLSAMVLRGSRYYVAHVGDSRIYRLRGDTLECLTTDHVWEHPELKNVLSRAIGLNPQLAVDYSEGDLKPGDIFILLSDGVWGTLNPDRLRQIVDSKINPHGLADTSAPEGLEECQNAAAALTDAALQHGAQDNCTALVCQVRSVPPPKLRQALESARQHPLPPMLKPGQTIDGLEVEEVLHNSLLTLLYRVRDPQTGDRMVLKTLRPTAHDESNTAALVHEAWLARRVTDSRYPQVVQRERQSYLYYLMTWHDGASLKQRLASGHRYSPAEVADIGMRLLPGIAALHRLSIIHRDIKPDNLHQDTQEKLRILDLGVAASDAHDAGEVFSEINNPGTPSYMAPELYHNGTANEGTDLYALGVTLYELLTRKYPYGEIEPFQKPRFGDPVPPTRYRPDIPQWLEAVLLKAVARDPKQRFETAEEFLLALERGAHRPLQMPRKSTLLERDPQLGLKLLAALSLVLNLFLLYLLWLRH